MLFWLKQRHSMARVALRWSMIVEPIARPQLLDAVTDFAITSTSILIMGKRTPTCGGVGEIFAIR